MPQFAITGYLAFNGNNFGCMIAVDTMFDSTDEFLGSSDPMNTQPRLSV